MSMKKRIAIVLDGGIIQAVLSNEDLSDYEVLVIDYDPGYLEDDEITWVPQGDGTSAESFCKTMEITKPGIDIETIFR